MLLGEKFKNYISIPTSEPFILIPRNPFFTIGTVTFTNVPKEADVKLRSKPAKIVNFADFKLAKMLE